MKHEECTTLLYFLEMVSKQYQLKEKKVFEAYRLPGSCSPSCHYDGFRLVKISRRLWRDIIRFSHEFDVNNGDTSWHLFEGRNGHLVVFSRQQIDHLDSGHHAFLYPEEEEQYGAVSCLQEKESIWVVWKPMFIHDESFSSQKLWDATTAHDWFCGNLIPKVTEYYKSSNTLGNVLSRIKNVLKLKADSEY